MRAACALLAAWLPAAQALAGEPAPVSEAAPDSADVAYDAGYDRGAGAVLTVMGGLQLAAALLLFGKAGSVKEPKRDPDCTDFGCPGAFGGYETGVLEGLGLLVGAAGVAQFVPGIVRLGRGRAHGLDARSRAAHDAGFEVGTGTSLVWYGVVLLPLGLLVVSGANDHWPLWTVGAATAGMAGTGMWLRLRGIGLHERLDLPSTARRMIVPLVDVRF